MKSNKTTVVCHVCQKENERDHTLYIAYNYNPETNECDHAYFCNDCISGDEIKFVKTTSHNGAVTMNAFSAVGLINVSAWDDGASLHIGISSSEPGKSIHATYERTPLAEGPPNIKAMVEQLTGMALIIMKENVITIGSKVGTV